jgi:type II secretory pathway component GspD/PulD (secretin)
MTKRVLLAVMASATATWAQGTVAPGRDEGTVTLDVADASLPDVLRRLSDASGVNLVPDAGIEDRLTLSMTDAPLKEVLDVIARRTGTVWREASPRVIRISKPPRVTAEFRDSPLVEIIDVLAGKAGANIVISPDVDPKTRITMRFQNVPWDDALDALVKTAGFSAVREASGIVRIVAPEKLAWQMETRVWRLRYVRPQDLYRPKIEAPTLVGVPKGVDEPLKAWTVVEALTSALSREPRENRLIGSLKYLADSNSLVVTDSAPVLDRIDAILRVIDVEPPQVNLEVKLVSTRNADLAQVGILYTTGTRRGISIGSSVLFVPNSPHGSPEYFGDVVAGATSKIRRSRLPFGLGHDLVGSDTFYSTDFGITATLRLFEQDSDTRIEQRPTISALSDTEATIFVGESIRWAEIETQANQNGGVFTAVKESPRSPVQVGFQLLVIPHVVPGTGRIVLTVIPQSNALTGSSTLLPGFDEFQLVGDADVEGEGDQRVFLPRVATSTVVTRMMVESGNTAVVAGLIEDRQSEVLDKIPFAGDIPLVGHLFRHTDTQKVKNHLIVFITPRIAKTAESAAADAAKLEREAKAREAAEHERLKKGMTKEEWEKEKEKRREEERKEHERLKEGK